MLAALVLGLVISLVISVLTGRPFGQVAVIVVGAGVSLSIAGAIFTTLRRHNGIRLGK